MTAAQNKTIVVKIGGSTFGSHDTTLDDIVYLQKRGARLVIVHGGANAVTEWLTRQGTPTRFVGGERVTDKPALDMVTAVLGGLVNKEIVAAINSRGGRAVGLTGVDGALLEAVVKNRELGYVGSIVKVNAGLLDALLGSGFVPVIAPLSLHLDESEGASHILNINGDTVAGEIAAAIGAEKVVFLTDVAGIRDSSGRVIPSLTCREAEALITSGVATGGMIPKIKACLKALSYTSLACIINGKEPHSLRKEVEGEPIGTVVRA